MTTSAYAYDLAILTHKITHIQSQVNKLKLYFGWAHMDLEFLKCAISSSPNKPKLQPIAFITYLKAQNKYHKI